MGCNEGKDPFPRKEKKYCETGKSERRQTRCGSFSEAKHFASDHLWYSPPSEAFVRIAAYANESVEGV